MQSRLAAVGGVALLVGAVWSGNSVNASASPNPNPGAHSRGAALFESKGCAHCHGPAGVGGGKGPDLQQVRNRMDAAAIAKQVRDGSMAMPAFGSQFDEKQLADLVQYLRAKRKLVLVPQKPSYPAMPVPKDRDPDE